MTSISGEAARGTTRPEAAAGSTGIGSRAAHVAALGWIGAASGTTGKRYSRIHAASAANARHDTRTFPDADALSSVMGTG